MKYLSLQQAMLGMRVVLTDMGVLLKSPAGSAEYNHKGRRIKVNGHADYFPEHLRVKDKRMPKGGYVSLSKAGATVFNADGSVRLRLGCFDKTPIQSDERLMKCNDATEPFAVNEGQQFSQTVEFKADRFAIHENAQSIIDNAIANHKTNAQVDSRDNSHVMDLGHCVGNTVTAWRLSGQMHEAIINAVAESDLFKSLVSSVDAQAASIAGLQQAIPDAVNEAIRNALKPGGLLWSARSRGI
ncbi:hypothetical protein [Pseudocitrobacter corydidari]